jgi:hypothetical protein
MGAAANHEPLVLLRIVRDVASSANPYNPSSVSTRQWDSARPLSEDWAHAPSARRVAEQLKLPWARVKELAFMEPRSQFISLGHALSDGPDDWVTKEQAVYALRLVATRLQLNTLNPGEYRRERAAMVAKAGGRARYDLRLPTDVQISAVCKSWDRALARAGLRDRKKQPRRRIKVLTAQEALDRCFEHHHTEPTAPELLDFCRANGISMSRDRTRQWDAQVADWKESRRQAGRPVPDGPPIPRLRPNYAAPVGAAMEGEVRPQLRNDAEQLIGTVVEYLAQLPPGEGSSRRGYDDWAAKRPGTPYGSTFDRHGGWAHMRRLAQQQMKGPAAAKPTARPGAQSARLGGPARGSRPAVLG